MIKAAKDKKEDEGDSGGQVLLASSGALNKKQFLSVNISYIHPTRKTGYAAEKVISILTIFLLLEYDIAPLYWTATYHFMCA